MNGLGPIYVWLWFAWGAAFAIIEGSALYLRKYWPNRAHDSGGTLSELVWRFVGENQRLHKIRYLALVLFLAWLVVHFLVGGF